MAILSKFRILGVSAILSAAIVGCGGDSDGQEATGGGTKPSENSAAKDGRGNISTPEAEAIALAIELVEAAINKDPKPFCASTSQEGIAAMIADRGTSRHCEPTMMAYISLDERDTYGQFPRISGGDYAVPIFFNPKGIHRDFNDRSPSVGMLSSEASGSAAEARRQLAALIVTARTVKDSASDQTYVDVMFGTAPDAALRFTSGADGKMKLQSFAATPVSADEIPALKLYECVKVALGPDVMESTPPARANDVEEADITSVMSDTSRATFKMGTDANGDGGGYFELVTTPSGLAAARLDRLARDIEPDRATESLYGYEVYARHVSGPVMLAQVSQEDPLLEETEDGTMQWPAPPPIADYAKRAVDGCVQQQFSQ